MRFTVPAAAFGQAVSAVASAAAVRTTIPELTHFKCSAAADGAVTFQATDLEIGVVYTLLGGSVGEPGECILHGPRTAAVAKEHRDGDVTVSATPAAVRLACVGGNYALRTFDVAKFPDVASRHTARPVVAVTAADVRALARRTRFAVDREEGTMDHYDLRGVYLEAIPGPLAAPNAPPDAPGRLSAAATDSRVMAYSEVPAAVPEGVAERVGGLIPVRALDRLLGTLGADGDEVTVAFGGGEAVFRHPLGAVYTRLVGSAAKPFPNLRKLIPTARDARTPVGAEFFAAVRRAAITTDVDSKRIEIAFGPHTRLRAHGPDAGESDVTVAFPHWEGAELPLALRAEHLAAVGSGLGKENNLTLELIAAEKPAVFRYDGGVALVMRMQERSS